MQNSIECRNCGCKHSSVRHTEKRTISWQGKSKTIVRRHRVCKHCDLPYVTVETYEDEAKMGHPESSLPPENSEPFGSDSSNPFI